MTKILFTAALAALTVSALPAAGQVVPGDTGSGEQRGIQALNNSGQVGDVTLYARGNQTRIVLDLKSVPAGRREPAHIHRGKGCDQPIDPKPAFALSDVVNGHSASTVNYPASRLLVGNYVVVVHSSAQNMNHYVACGLLYQ